MDTAYHPAFGQQVKYSFERLPDAPDAQVKATLRKLVSYIREDSNCDMPKQDAMQVLQLGNGDVISGLWKFSQEHIRFRED
jgi:hypothetical protein